jgi:hypothetical protein
MQPDINTFEVEFLTSVYREGCSGWTSECNASIRFGEQMPLILLVTPIDTIATKVE